MIRRNFSSLASYAYRFKINKCISKRNYWIYFRLKRQFHTPKIWRYYDEHIVYANASVHSKKIMWVKHWFFCQFWLWHWNFSDIFIALFIAVSLLSLAHAHTAHTYELASWLTSDRWQTSQPIGLTVLYTAVCLLCRQNWNYDTKMCARATVWANFRALESFVSIQEWKKKKRKLN